MSAAYAIPPPRPELRASTQLFRQVQPYLDSPEALGQTAATIELYAVEKGREVVRRQLEEHLALRASREVRVVDEEGQARPVVRRSKGKLRTAVGTVAEQHLTYQAPERACPAPRSATLGLAEDGYSFPVRRLVAEQAARDAFDQVCHALEQRGRHVPKRQAEQLAVRAAPDFERFYERRWCPHMAAEVSLLVLTFDGKGGGDARARPARSDAQEGPARKAMTAHERPMKRPSVGEEKNRKRTAEVAAVHALCAQPRSAQDILDGEQAPAGQPRLRPQGKRGWASVAQEPWEVIAEAFEEAQRRDPKRRLWWVVLVNGNDKQLSLVKQAARHYGGACIS